jgi:phospholipid/cholesterol/gamma-HCH transport system substrate-binding protein
VDAADTYADQKDALADTLKGFPKFLSGLARITQYGSWVNLYACAIDAHLAPGVPGSFGTLPGDTHTEVCR